MKGWTTKTIGELCDAGGGKVQTGPFGSQLHESDYSETGTPVVMPKDIPGSRIDESSIARISEAHVYRLRRHQLQKGDVVYGRRGDIGRQALVRDENIGWLCGTGCLRVTLGNSAVTPEFLHRYLQLLEVIRWIGGQAIGATMPNLNTNILRRIPVTFPVQASNQSKIVAILSAYDELIENNRRRIALLEKLAEEIYREWFVRLRFPGREKLNFVKGIPENWEPVLIADLLKRVSAGKKYEQKTAFESGKIPILDQGQTGIIGYHDDEPGVIASLDQPIIVFANHTCYQRLIFFPFSAIQNVLPFLPSDDLKANIYWLHMTTHGMVELSDYKGHWPAFVKSRLYFPGSKLTDLFGQTVGPIFQHKFQIEKSITVLTRTRDLLLPRLISGKLSVEDLDIQFPPGMAEESAATA